MRIGSVELPESGRSKWAREVLADAVGRDLTPAIVPPHKIKSFTVTLPVHLAEALREKADRLDRPVSQIAAGLIESAKVPACAHVDMDVPANDTLIGQNQVKSVLRPLVESVWKAVTAKKIAFAEAATGTGKGMMIASLAATAVAKGQSVVISAPLSVTWQLIEDLAKIPEVLSAGVTLLLGRVNFVSPVLLREWAVENDQQSLVEWIDGGGQPRSEKAISASKVLGVGLNWLLEDAMDLAEDIPAGSVSLAAEDGSDECAAEAVYQALKGRGSSVGVQICSHHLLASRIQQSTLWKGKDAQAIDVDDPEPPKGLLASNVDLLLIDEAHLFEQAVASIYTHGLYFRTIGKEIQDSTLTGKRAALEQLELVSSKVNELISGSPAKSKRRYASITGRITEFEGLGECISALEASLGSLKLRKKDTRLSATLGATRRALRGALSGYTTIRLEQTPVRKYPHLLVGTANLEAPLTSLWDKVGAAVLVSATLYTDGESGSLTRWKMAIPKHRAEYFPSVYPSWVFTPVVNRNIRTSIAPDDSEAWAEETVANVRTIAANAEGGTLVLCTSYLNAHQIASGLAEELQGRLIVQDQKSGASVCAAQFRELYKAGVKPVWIGVGAAWTGINLRDDSVIPAEDRMLTDLVIPRLPWRLNRSLSHQRRVAMVGGSVDLQEANWHFRQGIGRLVRTEGVGQKNLWVLDCRLDKNKGWASGFTRTLARYRYESEAN